jgi:hypothetical protein
MNDSTFSYPEFKEGQVLTHNDLNLLREYLYTKSMFHGRALFGFGVGCGLEGRIDGGTSLKIGTGFALAQGGRELRLTAEKSFSLTGTPATDPTSYTFIDAGTTSTSPGGFTPIIRPRDTIEPPGGVCDEDGCTTHTEVHHEEVEVVLVPGQLKLAVELTNPVFALKPIEPKTNPTLTGFAALRDALKTALTPYLEAATLDYLLPSKLKLEGPPGVDLRKVGLVNEVLYTTWDFFVCRMTDSTPCGGYTAPPQAVALGWLHKPGVNWIWEPRYRHWFQLSLALYRAMRGFRGQDVCAVYLDHIRYLLESFEVPAIPPSTGNGGGGTVVKDPGTVYICTAWDRAHGLCGPPRKELRYGVDLTRVPHRNPVGPDDYLTADLPMDETLTEILTIDPADSGIITITDFLGTNADKAGPKIKEAIDETGVEGKVTVLTLDAFNKVEGIVPALAVAATDAIFLAKNEDGAVIATGAVPTTKAIGDVAGIAETARNAEGIAKGMDGRITGVENGFTQYKKDLNESFGDFKTEMGTQFTTFKDSLPMTQINAAAQLAEDLHTVELEVGKQGATLIQMDTRTKNLETRGFPTAGGRGTNVTVLNTSLYESLDAMRDAIKAGSTQRAGPTVRRQLANVDAQFEVLRAESVEDVSLLEAHPDAVAEVMDGIVLAVGAMGLSPESAEYKNLTKSVDALKGHMGIG